MKFGNMDGMQCIIDGTSILVKIKLVALYNCRTVYVKNGIAVSMKMILIEARRLAIEMSITDLLEQLHGVKDL